MLPPGRARLETKPAPTGSFATAKTIGMVDVACFAARSTPPDVRMTSTLSRTNSAAISAARSWRPSAQRYSIATVRPSLQPSSRSRCTNAADQLLQAVAVAPPKKPIVGSFPACCARAVSGHAAAPPMRVMNSRRLMAASGFLGPSAVTVAGEPAARKSWRPTQSFTHRTSEFFMECFALVSLSGSELSWTRQSCAAAVAGLPTQGTRDDQVRKPLHRRP
jgi:hypothetical protein